MSTAVNVAQVETKQGAERFTKLSLEGLTPEQVTNPVLSTLLQEQSGQLDRDTLIKPEDEWLIFPD